MKLHRPLGERPPFVPIDAPRLEFIRQLAGAGDGVVYAEFQLARVNSRRMIATSATSLPGSGSRTSRAYFAFHATQERVFLFGRARRWNVPSHQLLRVIEQHAGGLAGFFVLEDFASERRLLFWQLFLPAARPGGSRRLRAHQRGSGTPDFPGQPCRDPLPWEKLVDPRKSQSNHGL